MKKLIFIFFLLFFLNINAQIKKVKPTEFGQSNIVLLDIDRDCSYLNNNNKYYSYYKVLNKNDFKSYQLDNSERNSLKNELTSTIVSVISTQYSNQVLFRKKNNSISNKQMEDQIFKLFSRSSSDAILFNPQFVKCNDNGTNKIIVYIEKNKFDSDQKRFFKSNLKRLSQKLTEYEIFKVKNPNYLFDSERKQLNSMLNLLRSYYGLMISLEVDEKSLDDFLVLENKVENFDNSINNLDNNLIKVNEYLSTNRFSNAYNLIKELKIRFDKSSEKIKIEKIQNKYLKLVKLKKKERLKEYKKEPSSYNILSLEGGLNTGLINNSTNSLGELNYSTNSTFDRLYPILGVKLIFKDRDNKWGLGPYYIKHFSKSLIVIKNIEYFFPFSSNISEAGLWGEYSFNYSSSLIFGASKLLEQYQDLKGEKLNFWSFTPGYKIAFNKTSLFLKFVFTRANSQYSFSGFSMGLSYDLKVNKKISDNQKNILNEDFPDKF